MIKLLAFTYFIFTSQFVFGQVKNYRQAFIIKGQLTDCPEKFLKIYFKDKNGQSFGDTINLDKNGNFYLKTFNVDHPQKVSIQQNNIQINDIFVAPGYNLRITANGKDFFTLKKTKKITGIGSESNSYQFMLDSILISRDERTNLFELNETNLLLYLKKYKVLQDSIAHFVFDRKFIKDKYRKEFSEMVQLNINFLNLDILLSYINRNKYNQQQSVTILRNNFDTTILDNIFSDKYLVSDRYTSLIGSDYLKYLLNFDYQKDPSLENREEYKLKKVNEIYQGKVKEFVLHKLMKFSIQFSKSFDDLNNYKIQFEPYVTAFSNYYYEKSINLTFSQKGTELLMTQNGKPAPKFTLESNSSQLYSLDDFKGKVVYIDLWASWCGPCRDETPSFKKLYKKYSNDDRIAFIGIAVKDGINQWKKALEEDKPNWIQLLDKEGTVSKSYVADMIPKFILIDKKGNIVSFDAPRPSSGEELESLLNKEIVK